MKYIRYVCNLNQHQQWSRASHAHPSIRTSVRLSVRLFVHLSVRPSVCPFVRLSVRPSVRLPVRLSVRPSVFPFVCPSVRLSVCPSGCLSVRLSVRPSVCPSVCLYVCPLVCPSVRMSVRLSVRLSLRLCVCPYIWYITSIGTIEENKNLQGYAEESLSLWLYLYVLIIKFVLELVPCSKGCSLSIKEMFILCTHVSYLWLYNILESIFKIIFKRCHAARLSEPETKTNQRMMNLSTSAKSRLSESSQTNIHI